MSGATKSGIGIRIPFNRPTVSGAEQLYMQQVLAGGRMSGDGEFTKKCSQLLERLIGCPKVLLTTSCTHALEMAALLLNVGPGDEVIVPSFTFVSTANAFALRGAQIIFADIRSDTLNIDEKYLSSLINEKTRAIVPVHYAGVGCAMSEIMKLANQHHIAVVEDNAHGLFAKIDGKQLGTFGSLATQSFHETKNFQCGEGGALIINDERLVDRAEVIREKGTNRTKFFKGHTDKYTWVDMGSSYLPSDLLAAFLLAQIEQREQIQRARERLWNRYFLALKQWSEDNNVGLPIVPVGCEQPYHLFYLLLPSAQKRDALLRYLNDAGILAVFHYVPLHSSPMGQHLGAKPEDCPVASDVSSRLLRLPFYTTMSEEDQQSVIDTIKHFSC